MSSTSSELDDASFYYAHTDPWRHSRWTVRECHRFMYERSWHRVLEFYNDLVGGRSTLSALIGIDVCNRISECYEKEEFQESKDVWIGEGTGRWARATFKIVISYDGNYFDGWQKQPGLNTVQGLIEKNLGQFVDEKKLQRLKGMCLPGECCAAVAGRTDKGVTALRQVCSFYTWRKDVETKDIHETLNGAALGKLRALSVSKVSRVFHPNFSAKWRRYFYIFPLYDGEDTRQEREGDSADGHNISPINGGVENESEKKPNKFNITMVDRMFRLLEGKTLSYKMFARDTKASRNEGPQTECFVYYARAMKSILPFSDKGEGSDVMCVELVANRFLRKMVRVLVATAVREAAAGADESALLRLVDTTSRRATAPPAPSHGLCLVDVGYSDFDERTCLIS